jgi:hypothetical protein
MRIAEPSAAQTAGSPALRRLRSHDFGFQVPCEPTRCGTGFVTRLPGLEHETGDPSTRSLECDGRVGRALAELENRHRLLVCRPEDVIVHDGIRMKCVDATGGKNERPPADQDQSKTMAAPCERCDDRSDLGRVADDVAVVDDDHHAAKMRGPSDESRDLLMPSTSRARSRHLVCESRHVRLDCCNEFLGQSSRRAVPLLERHPCDRAIESCNGEGNGGRLACSGGSDDMHERVARENVLQGLRHAWPDDHVVGDPRQQGEVRGEKLLAATLAVDSSGPHLALIH